MSKRIGKAERCEQCGGTHARGETERHVLRRPSPEEVRVNGSHAPIPYTMKVCRECCWKGYPWVRSEDSDDAHFYTKGPTSYRIDGVAE